MSVSAKDVAKHANVSPSTVSRVINGDPRISEKTRDKVLKWVKKLDYRVNTIARSLKTNLTHTVGFIAPEISEEFFMRVAKGAEQVLQEAGYSLIICNSNNSIVDETARIELLREKQVDGVIIIPSTADGENFEILRDNNIPVVLADRYVTNFEADIVLVDNVNGVYSVIEHLINQNATRIGFIGGERDLTNAQERYEGYVRALRDYNIPLDESLIKFGDFHIQSGYDMTRELMTQENPPDHLFISNYYMHVGAVKYFIETEKKPPFKPTITSFDDMHLSSLLGHADVTVAQPVIEIGQIAAELLLNRIHQKEESPKYLVRRLKPQLNFYKI